MTEAVTVQKKIKVIALIASWMFAVWCGYFIGIAQCRENSQIPAANVDAVPDPVAAFRSQRVRQRQAQVAQLNEIIHNAQTGSEIKALAQERIMDLMDSAEKESSIEGILAMRGFADATAIVRAGRVHIFARQELMTEQHASIILQCVAAEMEISAGNVKIIPIK